MTKLPTKLPFRGLAFLTFVSFVSFDSLRDKKAFSLCLNPFLHIPSHIYISRPPANADKTDKSQNPRFLLPFKRVFLS
jgi:hypothetical protein